MSCQNILHVSHGVLCSSVCLITFPTSKKFPTVFTWTGVHCIWNQYTLKHLSPLCTFVVIVQHCWILPGFCIT